MIIDQLDLSIKNSKSILLVSHINPDGDTLGSMCGLYSLIKDNYKKKCDMVAVSKIPERYLYYPYIDKIKNVSEFDNSREYDLVITLDVASIDRCTEAQTLFNKAKNTINIDHHKTNNAYGKINIIEPFASATAEVLVGIAFNCGWEFSKTTKRTMDYAGRLLEFGVDPSVIYQNCYESDSKNMVLFQAYCVGKAKFLNDDKIAYTTVYKKDLEKFNNKGEDFTEGLTEKLRSIVTTEIAFVIKELNSSTSKLSMRSKKADVSKICSVFDGGGHKFASGAVIKASCDHAVNLVLKEIQNQKLC